MVSRIVAQVGRISTVPVVDDVVVAVLIPALLLPTLLLPVVVTPVVVTPVVVTPVVAAPVVVLVVAVLVAVGVPPVVTVPPLSVITPLTQLTKQSISAWLKAPFVTLGIGTPQSWVPVIFLRIRLSDGTLGLMSSSGVAVGHDVGSATRL